MVGSLIFKDIEWCGFKERHQPRGLPNLQVAEKPKAGAAQKPQSPSFSRNIPTQAQLEAEKPLGPFPLKNQETHRGSPAQHAPPRQELAQVLAWGEEGLVGSPPEKEGTLGGSLHPG